VFSIAIVMLGLSAAVFGTWVDAGGPRKAMVAAAFCWSVGFLVGAAGIATNQLWLLYLGYGVIGGIGLGIGYIPPVSTLIKWFPDRPGLATGMAIMGFGGGALIASPVSSTLLAVYDSGFDPDDVTSVASGSAVASLFVTLGLAYLVVMLFGAWLVRVPAADWQPEGFDPSEVKEEKLVTTEVFTAKNAVKTLPFWLLWIVLFCNVTAGIGILEQASPMIQDFFRDGGGSSSVAPAAAAGFVGLLSISNMAGRFCGRAHRTTPGASGSMSATSASEWSATACSRCSATCPPDSSCCWPASSSRSTAVVSRRCLPISATSSAPTRWARSTDGCSPRGRRGESPGR